MPFKLSWPVADPVILQPFGVNWTGEADFYTKFGLPAHEGIDFKAPHGTPIYACADGTVTRIERLADNGNAYGIQIRIEHVAGSDVFETVYGHLQEVGGLLAVGSAVTRGEPVGLSDNTGNSRGDHLHLTLKLRGSSAAGIKQELGDHTWAAYPSDVINPTPYLPK